MIIGLGTDITELARIKASYDRFGRRFLQKILTEEEQKHLPESPLAYIAGRFAAKEATVKALGTGFRDGLGPLHVEVLRGPAGQPLLHLHGPACRRAEALGMRNAHISISHDRNAAVAVVVLEA
ncbi:holo-[acyl-carrier-protein] synthase [Desulfovibrio desulfuricans]|uniref:Holo-[acyl-carrier-protein] synthase n=1 Tax=Desulfovibrio desulfuricans TaxID=876 RepID=A0A4P7UGX9_DESDE|nr:holo-[acyl-carrier-protein] synthase [Desulfovibrio desulfuricans]QCC85415.1 holo-[acyl-carrier-protein] synthase [Desulfovibrio desulfuricans]